MLLRNRRGSSTIEAGSGLRFRPNQWLTETDLCDVRTILMATNYSHAAVDSCCVLKELDLLGTILEFQQPF